jgi:enhancing lycopene biosynthesis protein 2
VTLTLGSRGEKWPYNGSIDVAKDFGNTLEEKKINEVSFDSVNNIYSTPAYMKDDAKPHEVFEGIDNMIKEIAKTFSKKE